MTVTFLHKIIAFITTCHKISLLAMTRLRTAVFLKWGIALQVTNYLDVMPDMSEWSVCMKANFSDI